MRKFFILLLGFIFLSGPALEPHLFAQQTGNQPAKKKTVRKSPSRKKFRPQQTKIEPERAKEIQNALIREGLLEEPASGKWDKPTEQAMSDYQRQNGFKVTGKPDAKSLRKLGL